MIDNLSDLENKTILLLGLAFKPGTDDIRESPCVPIIKGLIDQGMSVHLHDPEAINQFKKAMEKIGLEVCRGWCHECIFCIKCCSFCC